MIEHLSHTQKIWRAHVTGKREATREQKRSGKMLSPEEESERVSIGFLLCKGVCRMDDGALQQFCKVNFSLTDALDHV